MREVILHCFQWQLKDITKNLSLMKDCGYSAIQVSPVQPCKQGYEWWKYYQPLSFSIGNKSGTKEDLITLCNEANKIGIKIIVDVVLRHVAGVESGQLMPSEFVDTMLKANPCFFTYAGNTCDYHNRSEIIHSACGMPMLNYDNYDLQDIYIKFLNELKSVGVSGFRIDMGKHFALKEEGSDFWERVFGPFKDMFNYAEMLECDSWLLDKYTNFINVLSDKDATDRSKMVVYIMSHDTELTFKYTVGMTDEIIIREWNNLLNDYKNSSVLFYVRSYSDLWKNERIKHSNLMIA